MKVEKIKEGIGGFFLHAENDEEETLLKRSYDRRFVGVDLQKQWDEHTSKHNEEPKEVPKGLYLMGLADLQPKKRS